MSDLPHIGPAEAVQAKALSPVNNTQVFISKPLSSLISFLGIGRSELTKENESMLERLWDYIGEKTQSADVADRLRYLRGMETKLSPPHLGQTRLDRLAYHIHTQSVIDRAEQWRTSQEENQKEIEGADNG